MVKGRLVADRRKKADRTKYIRIGLTAFLVLAAVVVLAFMFVNSADVKAFFKSVKSALAPVIYGVVIAYLLTPVVNFFEKIFSRAFQKHAKKLTRAKKAAKGLSIVVSLLIAIASITAIIYLVAPELVKTVTKMVDELPKQVENFLDWVNNIHIANETINGYIQNGITSATEYVEKFIQEDVVTKVTDVAQYLITGVWDVVSVVYNLIIGFVFAIYVLCSKERFAAQAKKLTYAIWKRRAANNIIRTARRCHTIFSGAIIGKIIDSAIVGLICFVGMSALGLEYASLIAVIVGVTNVIPFFGPYIGAIPSALLLLLIDPMHCLYFIIFVTLLQQLDCNVLDPRIVGGSIGLSAFWVLFACIFFGGMFGLVGMVLGVPSFACIYTIVKEIVETRLAKKGLATETDDYADVDALPEQEMILVNGADDSAEYTIAQGGESEPDVDE